VHEGAGAGGVHGGAAGRTFTLLVCADSLGERTATQVSIPARDGTHQNTDANTKAHDVCPFAGHAFRRWAARTPSCWRWRSPSCWHLASPPFPHRSSGASLASSRRCAAASAFLNTGRSFPTVHPGA
jgi:hypothetical protein